MRGWFDAFRENGGPTLYSHSNRTAVTADAATLILYIVFITLFLAFVIIFPGVRRQRFTTFTSVALQKGLPFPILTVGEYFTGDAEGFCWGRNYREAGYYTSIFLWMAFALWVLSNLMLVVVPRYGAYLVTLTGFTLLFCNFIYFKLLPSRPLLIRLEQSVLMFNFGWSYWLVLVAGCLCVLMGGAVSIIDLIYPHKFSTILEVDFGTPFDRHTIIEDSQETKKKKKNLPKLEEPQSLGLGTRLLRRLSKRDREGRSSHPDGIDNYAFEMEAPKSPWRYPHLMFRNDSRKQKNVSFRRNHL